MITKEQLATPGAIFWFRAVRVFVTEYGYEFYGQKDCPWECGYVKYKLVMLQAGEPFEERLDVFLYEAMPDC